DLVDRSSKTLRHLALSAHLRLSPDEERTGEEHKTGYAVEQSGSNIVFRLESICRCAQTNFLELHLLFQGEFRLKRGRRGQSGSTDDPWRKEQNTGKEQAQEGKANPDQRRVFHQSPRHRRVAFSAVSFTLAGRRRAQCPCSLSLRRVEIGGADPTRLRDVDHD